MWLFLSRSICFLVLPPLAFHNPMGWSPPSTWTQLSNYFLGNDLHSSVRHSLCKTRLVENSERGAYKTPPPGTSRSSPTLALLPPMGKDFYDVVFDSFVENISSVASPQDEVSNITRRFQTE